MAYGLWLIASVALVALIALWSRLSRFGRFGRAYRALVAYRLSRGCDHDGRNQKGRHCDYGGVK